MMGTQLPEFEPVDGGWKEKSKNLSTGQKVALAIAALVLLPLVIMALPYVIALGLFAALCYGVYWAISKIPTKKGRWIAWIGVVLLLAVIGANRKDEKGKVSGSGVATAQATAESSNSILTGLDEKTQHDNWLKSLDTTQDDKILDLEKGGSYDAAATLTKRQWDALVKDHAITIRLYTPTYIPKFDVRPEDPTAILHMSLSTSVHMAAWQAEWLALDLVPHYLGDIHVEFDHNLVELKMRERPLDRVSFGGPGSFEATHFYDYGDAALEHQLTVARNSKNDQEYTRILGAALKHRLAVAMKGQLLNYHPYASFSANANPDTDKYIWRVQMTIREIF
jgi:hypothetical protein